MNKISIVKAVHQSMVGAQLNVMALEYMAFPLAGSEEKNTVDWTFCKLWRQENNRFSHQYAYEAQMDGKTLGMITCYPISVLNRLAWPTFKQLLSFRKLGFVVYNILNIKMLYSMFTLKEGEDDEFHIGTIALLPESRGLGIGTRLIEFAEEQASLQGFAKCSLTVKKENQLAIKLYQRIGYQIIGEINKPKLSLYRMVKNVEPYNHL
ncbi:TPA: GNAT family N-acetyltransferase [Bacillus cereus]|uniref:GNAT family N-acetyltransferase n=1 Tax=Bacillus TaxID=1386 RepID=UPI0007AC1A46|nr:MULTISPECIES: N-acetyltransferase [Bacillus]ARV92055.1 GNAT family N-acetyltransferase [Bacillus thuringiensis]KZD87625.1 Acetyltransferase [Bacillus cereus]MCI2249732.1 GNAT family N-acetyltransferase [Bacillus cereus]MCQ6291580.1 GNAT family N-acetyltransferase [Bacillus cereus]MCT1380760.1 GNAT family N-acetyltransferase [Bacillus sp. p3-SID196]